MCSIVDLSEAGCQCHFSIADLDEETCNAWKQILSPGRVLSVELTEPMELRNLIFREAQVRWLKTLRDGDLDFGLQFGPLDDYQKEILANAMMQFASEKLRAKKAAEALTKTAVRRPPQLPTLNSTDAAVSAFTLTANNAVEKAPPPPKVPPAPPKSPATPAPVAAARTEPAQPLTATRTRRSFEHETTAPAATASNAPQKPGERQKRQNVFMAALFEFCDSKGGQWENGIHQGRTVDMNEGGFKLEGPAPDCCEAEQLISRDAHMIVIIRNPNKDIRCRCRVRSVSPSPNMREFWTYGVQITDITEEDRKLLRELYIRAGFAQISKRR